MQEKKYLKWYHKIGYGSGDIAGNCVYALLTAFMMIYLTDTIGLSMGVVSTLIALSKVFDGVSDFFFCYKGLLLIDTDMKSFVHHHGIFRGQSLKYRTTFHIRN